MADIDPEELQVQIQYALVEKLSISQRRQARLLELLDECIFECDAELQIAYLNLAWSRRFGYDTQAILGQPLHAVLAGVDPDIIDSLLEQARAEKPAPQSIDIRLPVQDKKLRWFQMRLSQDENGGYLGTLFDIQEHKEIEERLREQERSTRQLSLVASHTSNMVLITDRRGQIEWVNTSFEDTTGYTMAEVQGRRPGDILQGPDSDADAITVMSEAVEQGKPFNVEIVNYTVQGQPYWVAIDASPVKDENGEIFRFIAIETDISERRRAEKSKAESEFNYRSVVDNIPEIVLRLSPQGQLLFMNFAGQDMFGISKEQLSDRSISHLFSPEDGEKVSTLMKNIRAGDKEVFRGDLQVVDAQGRLCWVETTITPIGGKPGEPPSFVTAAFVDVDARVQAAEALGKAKQQAEDMAESRSRFLANISHEIRTPLNAVIGSADLLVDTALTQEQQRYTELISTSSATLLSLLDDILTHSRFEAGAIAMEQESYNLLARLEEALTLVTGAAQQKGLHLVFDFDPKLPVYVVGDGTRFRQLVINLLSNAIKFTFEGQVIIRVRSNKNTESGQSMVVEVEDTGIGIKANKLKAIFDPFTQSDVSTTRRFGGSGLGLSICSQICAAAGGTIQATSVFGEGSIFRIELPLVYDESYNREVLDPIFPPGQAPRVWYVGEASAHRTAFEHLMTRNGAKLHFADSVDQLKSVQTAEFEFLVVANPADTSACQDYIGALKKCRPFLIHLHPLADTPGIGVINTAEFSLKGPLTPTLLLRFMSKLNKQTDDDRWSKPFSHLLEEKSAQSKRSYPDKTVLVVEDNPQNQLIVSAYLHKCKCNVLLAEHGVQALEILKNEPVDLVIMDCQMPVMDGFTATRAIRTSDEGCQDVPIVALTADAIRGDREKCLSIGMNDYLSKPVQRGALFDILDHYLAEKAPENPLLGKTERLRRMAKLLDSLSI